MTLIARCRCGLALTCSIERGDVCICCDFATAADPCPHPKAAA